MNQTDIMYFIESALLASDKPLKLDKILDLFEDTDKPDRSTIKICIKKLQQEYLSRNIELIEVASGYRVQIKTETSKKLDKLWEWRSPRYSRALFETLALIAYKQPITRGEIEMVRGVSVSSNIIKSLIERQWIYIAGQRDVPGRPEMFGTTKSFLDYFGLKSINELPPLSDLSDWDDIKEKLDIHDIKVSEKVEKPKVNPILDDNSSTLSSHIEESTSKDMESALKISEVKFEELIHDEANENIPSSSEQKEDTNSLDPK